VSADYVRAYYGVPAKRGMRVLVDGRSGTIVAFKGAHLRVRFDHDGRIRSCHPTWRVHYSPATRGATGDVR
jgi:hypothetical protein